MCDKYGGGGGGGVGGGVVGEPYIFRKPILLKMISRNISSHQRESLGWLIFQEHLFA